jgi:excisionase family DNA binding protein
MKPLTVKQVAARWGVAKSTVYALVAAGRLPATRYGLGRGTIRISEEAVEKYERERERDDEKTYAEHFS